MAPISLSTALAVLRDAVHAHGVTFDSALLSELGSLDTELFSSLVQAMSGTTDPRIALEMAELVERQYRAVLRAQLFAIAALEATGAHTLTIDEYDAIRSGTTDTAEPPEHVSGRAHYVDTSSLVESWLGINHWEADTRVQDTHRMVARRTMSGTDAAPRYERLAALFNDPDRDPRPARDAARRIDKFEPADQIDQGIALAPTACTPDGVLLEEHAARILSDHQLTTASTRLGELFTAYTKTQSEVAKPEIGIFKRRTVQGVDQYLVRVEGTDAEVWRSMLAQADNRRTRAGQAARATQQALESTPVTEEYTASGREPADSAGPISSTADAPPSLRSGEYNATPAPDDAPWLVSTDAPPPWAAAAIQAIVPEAATGPDQTPATTDPGATAPDSAVASPIVPDGEHNVKDEPGLPDREPEPPRRRLNAIMALLTQRSTGDGNTATIVPSIIVTMTLKHLLDLATAHGITTHGVRLDAGELRQILVKARILPHVLGGQSQVLDAGRSRRFHSKPMRTALYVQDRGCIMPGCTCPPELCEANHWPEGGWAGGCGTSVREGSLLCPREHDDFHAGKFKMVMHNGLPHVLLPPHLDPTQTPQRNRYWFPNTFDGSDLVDGPPNPPADEDARNGPSSDPAPCS
ncbi:hypothetical protein OK351_03145 [Glutamicibacter sp. MNS18]|uniref:HNH endonuclease signature motif containing protein n=1 Tax=Glutamicibacter sp. MNS18 TaxID=2989817 RepID=UPI0022362CC9|nr:hypothetical protein [Glutamicibacter sp. MNS18]MCW4464508.1 hypothetical protein [Glutamicibacter sp. MNS18]